jgi:hypothetical protein
MGMFSRSGEGIDRMRSVKDERAAHLEQIRQTQLRQQAAAAAKAAAEAAKGS